MWRKTSYLHGDRVSNGYQTTAVKVFEAQQKRYKTAQWRLIWSSISAGQRQSHDAILQEINAVKKDACGEKRLKVIIETPLADRRRKIAL